MSQRLTNIKKLFSSKKIDGALISSISNIIYLTGYAGFSDKEREAFLLLTDKGQYIFTDGRYSHAVTTQVKNFQLLEISGQNSFIDYLKEIIKKDGLSVLGIENNNLTVAEHKKIAPLCRELKHFDLTELRIKKDKTEIELIKQACRLGDEAFSFILTKIQKGKTEKQIAFELEHFIRSNGGELSFPTIAAFGENAGVPHHNTGLRILENNEIVLLDFGVKLDNYCSDMTRTVFFGRKGAEHEKVYYTVLDAQRNAINQFNILLTNNSQNRRTNNRADKKNAAVPLKISASVVDRAARDFITKAGYPSIPHSLGHGIGLDIHERPWVSSNSEDILENGMVFSIEPGIYLPTGRQGHPDKFGVRIEDLFAIQDDKLIQLTNAPKNFIECD